MLINNHNGEYLIFTNTVLIRYKVITNTFKHLIFPRRKGNRSFRDVEKLYAGKCPWKCFSSPSGAFGSRRYDLVDVNWSEFTGVSRSKLTTEKLTEIIISMLVAAGYDPATHVQSVNDEEPFANNEDVPDPEALNDGLDEVVGTVCVPQYVDIPVNVPENVVNVSHIKNYVKLNMDATSTKIRHAALYDENEVPQISGVLRSSGSRV